MTVTINGTTGITTPAVTNEGAYTGDGVVFADSTPSNTLVTTTGGRVGIGTSSPITVLSSNGSISAVNYGKASLPRIILEPVDNGAQKIAPYGTGVSAEQQLAFCSGVNADERMRIDSSGNVYVGADTTCNLTDFRSKSLGADGYQKIAGGMIIQWGYSAAGGTTQTISYPITFPNAVFSVQVQMVRDSVNYQNTVVNTSYQSSTTNFTVRWDNAATGLTWIAIGY